MRDSNPLTGAIVASMVQVAVLSTLVALGPPAAMNLTGVAFFVASGLMASTIGRLLNYTSIDRLGVSVSATVIGSSPLFSTIFAALFIGERVAPATRARASSSSWAESPLQGSREVEAPASRPPRC